MIYAGMAIIKQTLGAEIQTSQINYKNMAPITTTRAKVKKTSGQGSCSDPVGIYLF